MNFKLCTLKNELKNKLYLCGRKALLNGIETEILEDEDRVFVFIDNDLRILTLKYTGSEYLLLDEDNNRYDLELI